MDRYTELIHNHFQHSVLDSLPEWLRKMDDTYGDGLSMGTLYPPLLIITLRADGEVAKPNPNLPVLVYCRRDCGEIALEE
jgi:GINS complex subunit 4